MKSNGGVNVLVAGEIREEVVVTQAEDLMSTMDAVTATQRQHLELAHELLDDIRIVDLKPFKVRIVETRLTSSRDVERPRVRDDLTRRHRFIAGDSPILLDALTLVALINPGINPGRDAPRRMCDALSLADGGRHA